MVWVWTDTALELGTCIPTANWIWVIDFYGYFFLSLLLVDPKLLLFYILHLIKSGKIILKNTPSNSKSKSSSSINPATYNATRMLLAIATRGSPQSPIYIWKLSNLNKLVWQMTIILMVWKCILDKLGKWMWASSMKFWISCSLSFKLLIVLSSTI